MFVILDYAHFKFNCNYVLLTAFSENDAGEISVQLEQYLKSIATTGQTLYVLINLAKIWLVLLMYMPLNLRLHLCFWVMSQRINQSYFRLRLGFPKFSEIRNP